MIMRQTKTQTRLRLEALEHRDCPSSTVVLPISAFLSQQGTTSVFNPPLPDFLGWTNSVFDPGATASDPFRFLSADYNGVVGSYLLANGINLHTQVTGFVTESTIAGGQMEVSVNLETRNALTWVVNGKGLDLNQPGVTSTAPLELGYRAQDLIADPTLTPALSTVHFQITFREQAGTPLPDLIQALIIGNPPPGFAPELIDFQAWGSGTLRAATTVGTAGQTAFVNTSQIGDLVHTVPGVLADGFIQEPINIVPINTAPTSIAYLNGSLFITDLANGNDNIKVAPTLGGGASVTTNFGKGTFAAVNNVVVSLGNGNNNVQVGNFPGKVNVAALDGNNNVIIGNESEVVVNAGGGNNHITVGKANPAMVFVAGNGNNAIFADGGQDNIYVGGNGNNHVLAAGTGDFLQLWGNGNNTIFDIGNNDTIIFAGDGNNIFLNRGIGSFTHLLAGMGKNYFFGPFGP
jgi:hypothetical protein